MPLQQFSPIELFWGPPLRVHHGLRRDRPPCLSGAPVPVRAGSVAGMTAGGHGGRGIIDRRERRFHSFLENPCGVTRENFTPPGGSSPSGERGKNHSPLEDPCGVTRENFTPPLRGSRRSRAVCAKADAVGGETRFLATPTFTPHQLACGLRPCLVDSPSRGE